MKRIRSDSYVRLYWYMQVCWEYIMYFNLLGGIQEIYTSILIFLHSDKASCIFYKTSSVQQVCPKPLGFQTHHQRCCDK